LLIADFEIDDCRLRLPIVDWQWPLNQQSTIPLHNRQSQSTIVNLNRQSAIRKSAVANPKSAIV